MAIDKSTLTKLKRFAQAFREARERDANESDTVVYLIKLFEEILSYSTLDGEICTELPIESCGNERYCDFAVRLGRQAKISFLVEAKKAGMKALSQKHIEQACNYASRSAIEWVVLTNGVMWQLYHLTFSATDGIQSDLVFELNFADDLDEDADFVWQTLSVLSKNEVKNDSLSTFYEQQKLLGPKNIVNVLLGEEVLTKVRQELNRKAPARLEMNDVFHAVTQVFSQDALAAAGNIVAPRKKHHHKTKSNGQTTASVIERITPMPVGTPLVTTLLPSLPQPPPASA